MAVLETIQKTQIMEYPALAKLGKEANDETFSKNELYNLLQKNKNQLKEPY